jgi:hypothetical protein
MADLNGPRPCFSSRILRGYAKWAQSQTKHIVRVQRWWRAVQHLKPSNTVDCITLEPVEAPVFRHVSEKGHVTAFTAHSLAQYMITSGNFTHPQYRTPFHAVELRRLDRCTGQQFQLLQNRERIQVERAQARNDNSLDEFLVNESMSVVQACIEICTQRCTRAEWSFQMRAMSEQLVMSFITLMLHNCELAFQTIHQAIDLVERQPAHLLAVFSDDLVAYFDACDRCFHFCLVLKVLRNDLTN